MNHQKILYQTESLPIKEFWAHFIRLFLVTFFVQIEKIRKKIQEKFNEIKLKSENISILCVQKLFYNSEMRQKLNRLLRFRTEQCEQGKCTATTTQAHHSRMSGAFSIRKFEDKKQSITQRQPFSQKDPNMTCSLIKTGLSKYRTKFPKNIDEVIGKSMKFDNLSKVSRKKMSRSGEAQSFIEFATKQIQFFNKEDSKSLCCLQKIIGICQKMIEQVYSYNLVEGFITELNKLLKSMSAKSLIFMGYSLSAQCLFIYGSYSLALYYADKALKMLRDKENVFRQERIKESQIYRTVTKIFLIKYNFQSAKQFGYKYLRKAWFLSNYQTQVDAYDLLGKIYHQLQEKNMSIYFHNRMCKGEREDMDIIRISNYELQKAQKEDQEFAIYETIEMFVQHDIIFHEMLEDRFRMKNRNFEFQSMQTTNPFFFHTHRSPNRNLNTYRVLERKMIQQKKSKELHFIKPKQKGNLKKIIGDFYKLIKDVRDNLTLNMQSSNSIDMLFTKTN